MKLYEVKFSVVTNSFSFKAHQIDKISTHSKTLYLSYGGMRNFFRTSTVYENAITFFCRKDALRYFECLKNYELLFIKDEIKRQEKLFNQISQEKLNFNP